MVDHEWDLLCVDMDNQWGTLYRVKYILTHSYHYLYKALNLSCPPCTLVNKAKIDVTKDLTRFKSDQTKAGWVSCQLLCKLRTNHLGSFVMALSLEPSL